MIRRLLAAWLPMTLLSCQRVPAPHVPASGPSETPAPPARLESLRVDTLTYGRLGRVVLYRRREHPAKVVLFVSGDGGWNLGVVRMAESLAGMDAAVVGIDTPRYLAALDRSPEACAYPPADLEALSQWVQRRVGYPEYVAPVLVGYSSGASLAYASLIQAPRGTFRGAISLGFSPELSLRHPLCRGDGLRSGPGPRGIGITLQPADSTGSPWIVLQGQNDSTYFAGPATHFVRAVTGAEIVVLPAVGHGFGVEAHWMPAFREAFERVTRKHEDRVVSADTALTGLPLVELRPRSPSSSSLAIIVSGDGGWASLDRQIGETLAAQGIPVVGLDALRYFWTARRPDDMGEDLARIVRHYLAAWHLRDLLLVGYSRGADTFPFMISRLPADLRDRIRIVALVAPSRSTTFEFHVTDWFRAERGGSSHPTAPEISKLQGLRVLCLYGTDDRDSVCPSLPAETATVIPMAGGHHFDGAYRAVAARILTESRGASSR